MCNRVAHALCACHLPGQLAVKWNAIQSDKSQNKRMEKKLRKMEKTDKAERQGLINLLPC